MNVIVHAEKNMQRSGKASGIAYVAGKHIGPNYGKQPGSEPIGDHTNQGSLLCFYHSFAPSIAP